MIDAKGLVKQFRIYRKEPGFRGTVKALFHREYESNEAVHPFDVSIQAGEIVGLLGPNGAGKTTLMKMFTGIVVPTRGELRVLGYDPSKRERLFKKKIALVMGQKSQLWWDLPAQDSFDLLQRFYEIDFHSYRKRLKELSELLEVEQLLHVHVRKLSLGERMKVELMASLLHQPDVIFLDEPTIGLDLLAQRKIRQFIADYHKKNGSTIILTSHYMADVQALCQRLVLLLEGEKRFDGSLSDFETLLGNEKEVSFTFSKPVSNHDLIWEAFDPQWNSDHTKVDLRIPESDLNHVSISILQRYPVTEFGTEKMPIERVMSALLEKPALLPHQTQQNSSSEKEK